MIRKTERRESGVCELNGISGLGNWDQPCEQVTNQSSLPDGAPMKAPPRPSSVPHIRVATHQYWKSEPVCSSAGWEQWRVTFGIPTLPLAILMCLFPVIRYNRGYSCSQEFYESFWRIIKLLGLQLCLGNSLDLHLSQKWGLVWMAPPLTSRVNSSHRVGSSKETPWGTSLVVQWLRIRLPMWGIRVPSLVRKLRSHMPWSH